jgi:AcrR family transcriptional regulator
MADRQGRREEILGVAASMFAESGFHGVSMDDLGAAVGMTGPALYRYFPGKEALLAEMLVDISERLFAGGAERVESAASPADALGRLVDFHVTFALEHPDLIAVQFRDLDSVPDPHRRAVRRLQSRYAQLWTDTLVAEGVDADRARSAVHAIFGLINSTPHSARISAPEMGRLLRSMALAALSAAGLPEVPQPEYS